MWQYAQNTANQGSSPESWCRPSQKHGLLLVSSPTKSPGWFSGAQGPQHKSQCKHKLSGVAQGPHVNNNTLFREDIIKKLLLEVICQEKSKGSFFGTCSVDNSDLLS